MCLVVYLGKVLEVKVGVNLGRTDIGVSKQLLHGTQLTTGLQHMSGEAMPEHVRMYRRVQTLFF